MRGIKVGPGPKAEIFVLAFVSGFLINEMQPASYTKKTRSRFSECKEIMTGS